MAVGTMVDDDRRTATIVGGLFIIALVFHLIGGLIYDPATGSADFLERAYPERSTVTLGVLIQFVAIIAIPLIGYFMFPVLRRLNEALALTYAGFRSLEAVFLLAIASKVLTLIDVSDDHVNGDLTTSQGLQAIGDAILAERDGIFEIYLLIFTIGALVFYGMLWKSGLVPRWLSIWGFASAAWMLVGVVLIMFDVLSATSEAIELIFVTPLPLNELTLAIWLIVKGFDDRSPVVATRPSRRPPLDDDQGTPAGR